MSGLISPILEQAGFVKGALEPVIDYLYSPKCDYYDYAYFNPITLDYLSTFSFRVKGISIDPSPFYFLGSEVRGTSNGNSSIHIRGSDGRFRFERDDGSRDQVTITSLSNGGEYLVVVKNNINNVEYIVYSVSLDGSLNEVERKTGTQPPSSATFTCIGARRESGTVISSLYACVFGVTLAGESSWSMQSESNEDFNVVDYISSNNLVFSGVVEPITEDYTVETVEAVNL